MDGWNQDLPLLPGYYWVRIAGYERAPTIVEIDIRDGVPMVLHEEPHEPDQEAQAPWWMPLSQEYHPEDEAAYWGPLVPPES